MKKLVILASIVAAVALAACGGGNSSNDSASAADPGGANAGTVSVQNLGGSGNVLVDSSGKALYASDQEATGMVLCTGGCESFWKPLTINGGKPTGSVLGKLGVVTRPDGSRQVTFDGKPLYSFTQDGSGEVNGDGFSDSFDGQQFTWHVVSVSGGSQSNTSSGNASSSSDNRGSLGY
jgi:predicted lipoprotein with Yx(FWY)xxD motif